MNSGGNSRGNWRDFLDTIELRIIESELKRLGVAPSSPTHAEVARAFEAALPRLRRYDAYWHSRSSFPLEPVPLQRSVM